MNIAVFGLGYVGVVNLACLSSLGHKIIGCDIKPQKVEAIKSGKSPVFEPEVEQMIQSGLEKGLIEVTTDAEKAVAETDLALICVGTPSRPDGTVNLDYTINTTLDIAKTLKEKNKKYTIVYRSTIPPGTIEDVLFPELEKRISNFSSIVKVAFLPEFLREGTAVKDFFNCSRIVIGSNEESLEDLESIFSYSKEIPLVKVDIRTAEFVKYVDNAFHAVKIAFANEVYNIGGSYNVDIQKANEIFLMDTHLNISPNYLKPGLPFGGSCLPKDMRAINQLARDKSVDTPLLESVLQSNSNLQQRMLDKVLKTGIQSVLLYGLSFKSDTDDVRESPMMFLAKDLIAAGLELKIYDNDLNNATLRIENPEIVKYIENDLQFAINESELIVICKKEGKEVFDKTNADHIIFNYMDNIKGYLSASKVQYLYEGDDS